VNVRSAEAGDAAAVASLAGELGYPTDEPAMRARLAALAASSSDAVFVGARDGEVAAWIHVAIVQSLEADPFAEIRGLVVTESARGAGLGTRLVEAAEAWARERRAFRVRIRSNVTRLETRRFYERRGYVVTKTSNVFDKRL
jgi:GNAT superfamily N-acetyltransferase